MIPYLIKVHSLSLTQYDGVFIMKSKKRMFATYLSDLHESALHASVEPYLKIASTF